MVESLERPSVPTSGLMSVEVRDAGPHPVVTVGGDIDALTVAALETHVDLLLEADSVRRLVLDLSAVEFVDSSGLSLLVRVHKRLLASGGTLVVVVTSTSVRRVLEVTGLADVLDLQPSLDAALAARPAGS